MTKKAIIDRAAETNRAARAIIDAESREMAARTKRLREARLALDASQKT